LIRVVVVDDSEVCRATLRTILESERDIRVVGEASDGSQALRVIQRERPHLVTMDLQMPGASGFDVIEEIMAKNPVPILVVTGQSRRSGAAAFEAIRRGALQLAEKPLPGKSASAADLRAEVRLLSKVPVVWHVAGARSKPRLRRSTLPVPSAATRTLPLVVGIAASAGGPGAIATVLGQVPLPFASCIVLVQHLPKGFTASFVDFLKSRTKLKVKVVTDEAPREPGVVLVAPDDRHLVLADRHHLRAVELPPVDGFRPSATVLFRSLADQLGPSAVGVVLSGMGTDGAEGLLRMRKRGSLTIAQDEASSAVYGMPRAAVEAGAAELVLPLERIAFSLSREPGSKAASRTA
jgi:two-component system chemotaxis response regulator CheB